MGAGSARITAADFVTPPEFRGYRLAADGAGRVGGVRLGLTAHGRTTRLGACYQQVPLRVLPPFGFGDDQPALVYLTTLAPGLMDGDGHLAEVVAGPGTRAVVTGQSATRVHPGLCSFGTQQWHVRVGRGAVLAVLPGPVIPYALSRYYQYVRVDLEPGAGFVWGDVWFAGRYARGALSEQFRFAWLIQDVAVRRAGAVVFRDRFGWRGPWDRDAAAWHFARDPKTADANAACGSVFITGAASDEPPAGTPELAVAAFRTAHGDTCLRWHGASEAVVRSTVHLALRAAARLADGCAGAPWLLSTHGLAATHWFSSMA